MRQRITIIGTGLIGTSLGLAIKQAKVDAEIVGHDKNGSAAAAAKKRGAVDKTDWNLHGAVDGAGLVIIATPALAIKATLEALAQTLRPGVIVSDTASTKQQVIAWAEEILPAGVHFVGGHPLTARAGAGPEDASASLFTNKTYCLIPARNASDQALETMVNLASAIGARPYFLDAAEHDAYVAATGHLPFLASAALVRATTTAPSWQEIRRLAGADFENASSPMDADPQTYADICQTNKVAILRWLDQYIAQLGEMKALVAEGGPDLLAAFTAGQEARAKWMATRDDDISELPRSTPVDGTGSQMKQIFMGNLMGNRPLPGEKKK